MIKFLLVIKVCSALDGTCLPEQPVGLHDSWYNCAVAGIGESISLMNVIGEDLINRNKLVIGFSCQPDKTI
tara:strand:- start:1104 stop:1316 length:213 start_codon:yes stop_codon:yes gene_type:complete